MTPEARIQATIEVLEEVQNAWKAGKRVPVDSMIASYFKSRRFIGSKDRGAISDLLYFTLRFGGTLEWHIEQTGRTTTPRRAVMVALYFYGGKGMSREQIINVFSGEKYHPGRLDGTEQGILDKTDGKPFFDDKMPLAASLNFPDWMEGRLKEAFGDGMAAELEALNEQAPIDLRVNMLKCKDRSDLIQALDRDGYFGAPTPYSPLGVRLKKRLPAFNTQAFKDGKYEMQDEGSQIAALQVRAKPGQKVIDFCAGAGGKTLAIAASMENKGRVLAWDNSEMRLKQIHKRLARAGVNNVQTHVLRDEKDPFIKRHLSTADWVLVDAPCSGSGTWRRNPDLKWRFTLEDLQEIKDLQQSILNNAARLVKSGGRLVYVTCSVFHDENGQAVRQFILNNPTFRVEAPNKIWNKQTHVIDGVGPCLSLSPHQDGTDGFFAAILVNNAPAS